MTQELLPCPWCGGRPDIWRHDVDSRITVWRIAHDCASPERTVQYEGGGSTADTKESLAATWNTRTQAPQTLREGEG